MFTHYTASSRGEAGQRSHDCVLSNWIELSFASLAEARVCFAEESQQKGAASSSHAWEACPACREPDPRTRGEPRLCLFRSLVQGAGKGTEATSPEHLLSVRPHAKQCQVTPNFIDVFSPQRCKQFWGKNMILNTKRRKPSAHPRGKILKPRYSKRKHRQGPLVHDKPGGLGVVRRAAVCPSQRSGSCGCVPGGKISYLK